MNRRSALQACLAAGASFVASQALGKIAASDTTHELITSTITIDMLRWSRLPGQVCG